MNKLKILSKYKYIIILLFIVIISLYRSNITYTSKYNINDTLFSGYVIDYKYTDNKLTFILKGKELIRCNYYIEDNNKIDINYNDYISVTGELSIPNNNTIPNTFNYKKYLNNNDIFYILNIDKINNIKPNTNYFYKIKNYINKRSIDIDKNGYLNMFILGNKNYLDNDTYNTYKTNGIIHIFSISGMHISLLAGIILSLLTKIKKNKYNILFVIIFLIFYLILTNYQASILRSIIFYIFNNINKILKKNIDTKNILLLSISSILIFLPKYIYNIGFLYSSLISFTLIYYSKYFNKNYILNTLLISFISFIISFPITINSNYTINLLSILINLIFVPLISFIIYPLSLLTFLIPSLINIFNIIINITEYISNILSNINIFIISLPKMNIIVIFIYYLLVYMFLSINKKVFIIFILFLIGFKYINILDNNLYIYYLDVGQGDSILIKNKSSAYLIDTGCKKYMSTYEITDNIIKFFYSIGVYDIDNIILTHGDLDHIGNANYLINNFKVKNVIFNKDSYNELESDLINLLNKKNIKYYKGFNTLNLNNYKLQFLNTLLYDNENDNSNIIYLNYNNYKFLFMGDASKEVENNLLNKYSLNNIDVLKVGHHGSNTSTSKEFLDKINPKYSIISVGKNNMYGHPNKEVLNNLKDSLIYRTDIDGTIRFKINNNLNIKIFSP